MFGINSFDQAGQIVEGHIYEAINKENELYNKRMAICRECPLYTNRPGLGPVCDARKCFDKETETVELMPRKGRICGCGCRLSAKVRVARAKCVLDKW